MKGETMATEKTAIPEEFKEARAWMKEIPAFGLLFVITIIVLEWVISVRPELNSMSATTRHSVAFVSALILAGIGYTSGNFWDDLVFRRLYGFDPKANFVGRYAHTTRRNLFGLLPAGDDLVRSRDSAIRSLLAPGSNGSGIYRKSKSVLLAGGKKLDGYLPLSKFFRSFIWPALLLGITLLVTMLYRTVQTGTLDRLSLIGAIAALLVAGLLFVPYINFRVEHMTHLYEEAVAVKAAQPIAGREAR